MRVPGNSTKTQRPSVLLPLYGGQEGGTEFALKKFVLSEKVRTFL